MASITMQQMLEAGVHFGHQTRRWNPKMKQFIYGSRGGIHIIDLEKTAHALNDALSFIKQEVRSGKTVLFVSTKQQTKELLPKAAQECGMPYVTERWLGGFLTNFKTIHKRITYLRDLEAQKQRGEIAAKFTKKEALELDREMEELNRLFAGTKNLDKLPDILFAVDTIRDMTAIREARRLSIPIVSLTDTNTDPSLIDYPIPSNDDGVRALELMLNTVSTVIKENAAPKQTMVPPAVRPVATTPAAKAGVTPEVIAEKEAGALAASKKAPTKKTPKARKQEEPPVKA